VLARKNSANAAQQLEEKVVPIKYMYVHRVYDHEIIEGVCGKKP